VDEQVTLTAYADQVRELIRNDRNDEASAICKHILRYYPKYIDAYRQLGEALLEKGKQDDAKELFRRVLSADPESVVAYAGLAVILEQEHLVAEATWHMERAYELAPSNIELHNELHRLYHELDGRPRARLKLTPGALARLYVQEGLFAQAIQELNAVIAASEARFDARVALAETLWRVGQLRQAADVAQALLKPLPYCLKANLILGAVWKETGLTESEQYLQRAQSLDPTNQIAQRIFGARSPLPLANARVPRYAEGAPAPLPSLQVTTPAETIAAERSFDVSSETRRELAELDQSAFKPPVLDTTLPPWLLTPMPEIVAEKTASLEPIADARAEGPESSQIVEPLPEPVVETTETPDWLAQLREAREASAEQVSPALPTESESELPEWIRAESKTEQAAPPTPAWIEEIQAATEAAASPVAKEETATEQAPTLPTWIAEEKRVEEIVTPQPERDARAEEIPEWLSQLTAKAETEPAPEPAATPRVEETPAWLDQLTAKEPAPEPEVKPRVEETPAWLDQLTAKEPAPEPEVKPREPAPVARAEPRPSAPKRKPATRGDSHLILARAYRDANQFQEALGEYDYIVQKAPRLINQVIADLEALAKQPGVPLDAHRILGDAYTRADRLAEALEEYRFVLGRVA